MLKSLLAKLASASPIAFRRVHRYVAIGGLTPEPDAAPVTFTFRRLTLLGFYHSTPLRENERSFSRRACVLDNLCAG
jgi:hypothetical protein